ncbi:hypothetical protein ACHAXN_013147 [Cyclotella atomus]
MPRSDIMPRPAAIIYTASILCLLSSCAAFTFTPRAVQLRHETSSASKLNLSSEKDQDNGKVELKSNNPLELAAWYGVEAFGKLFNKNNDSSVNGRIGDIDLTKSPTSMKETLERIQLDNDRYYFLSGEVDRLIYDENCLFADPFVSFNGRDRFIDNLSNLGSFITNYNAKMIRYDVNDDGSEVNTKIINLQYSCVTRGVLYSLQVMVKIELNLPWKPVLAWPWGVKYGIDPESYLVTSHKESWDIEPLEGVKQIFRKPTVKISQ